MKLKRITAKSAEQRRRFRRERMIQKIRFHFLLPLSEYPRKSVRSALSACLSLAYFFGRRLVFLSTLLFFACQTLPEGPGSIWNPLDPNSPGYQAPSVDNYTGPKDNQIVNSSNVSFSWSGSLPGTAFRHKLDGNPWTDFSEADTSVTLNGLDDGSHTFYLQARYASGALGDVQEFTFVVDDIEAPAIFCTPRQLEINNGATFSFEFNLDIEDSASALNAIFTYNAIKFTFVSAEIYDTGKNGFFAQNGGQLINFVDEDSGKVTLSIAMVEGSPKDISGTGKVGKLTFKHKTGSSANINISNTSTLRNSRNEDVPLTTFVGCSVVVK